MKRLIVLVLAALALSGCGAPAAGQPTAAVWSSARPDINDDASGPPVPDSPSPSPSPSPSRKLSPSPSRKPSPSPSRKPSATSTASVLSVYGTNFVVAGGGTGVIGSGTTLRRYEVAVQSGLSETPASVAATVDSVLGNQARGWLRGGGWRFQRVSSGPYDFVVELATPGTTDYICGKYGIQTQSQVSCRGGPNVVINLTRWEQGTNGTTQGATVYSPADYRVLVINHEFGHALGHDHVPCPAAGAPAPVMMTSYFGLDGCVQNIWPYAADGTYLD